MRALDQVAAPPWWDAFLELLNQIPILVKELLQDLGSWQNIIQHPYASATIIGIFFLGSLGSLWSLKNAVQQWAIDQAQKTTEDDWQNDVNAGKKDNQDNNSKDNSNINDLNNMQ